MQPLLYIIKRTLVNTIKKIIKRPLLLIGYTLGILFVVFILILSFLDSSFNSYGSYDLFFSLAVTALFIYAYFTLKKGIDNGSSFFRLADVNMVFTSPIKSNNILFYGFLKQLTQIFSFSLLALMQVPNLRRFFSISQFGVLIILIGFILYMLTLPIISMIIYSYTSKNIKRRKIAKIILNLLFLAVLFNIVFQIIKEQTLLEGFTMAMSTKFISYLPVIGWNGQIIAYAISGITPSFYVFLGLSISSIFLLILWLYSIEKDYYEDALVSTEFKESVISTKAKNGFFGIGSLTKIKSVSFTFTKSGAMTIFQRSYLELRKTGMLLFDKVTIMILVFVIIMRVVFYEGSILFVLLISVYILFLSNVNGRFTQELSKHYIYLIPVHNTTKLLAVTAMANLKNLLDGFILFIIAGFLYKQSIPLVILCGFTYASFGSIYLYGDLLARKLFGSFHANALKIFFKILLTLLILTPGIILAVIVLINSQSFINTVLILLSYNIFMTTILLLISSTIFKYIELG
ncbi:MAG: putative ABC exporter domain-containing protein [Clostridiales bacterium]|nr:putative ABC exporter domain-containing protein [Clostridiales bacterium]